MRPSRDSIFMEGARVFAKLGTCPRAQVGAVIVLERRIISCGYNGSPPDQPHCLDVGCDLTFSMDDLPREDPIELPLDLHEHCQRTVHAEANAIAWAARAGVPVGGATLYCTHAPCLACAKLMGAAGIVRSVYEIPYRLEDGIELLKRMGADVEYYP